MAIWDGGDTSQPFWEREALQLAAEGYEPEEIDLAPGTEPPPPVRDGQGPHEPPMRRIEESRKWARRTWAEILRLLQGAQRMIRFSHVLLPVVALLSLVASHACAQGSGGTGLERTAGMAGEVHCVGGLPVVEPPLPTLTGLERAENIRHEAVHASQFSIGCDSIAALWAREPFFRLALEAEATCTGLKVWADSTARRYRKGLAAARISAAYGNVVGFEDIYDELGKYCDK